MALKAGRKVTVEVWQWEKNPKANPYLPREETIIPEQDCQIPFLSLYPCGRQRKETAVLLCNWGLSITGFMHDFRWVTHNFPDVSCCFEASRRLPPAGRVRSDLFSTVLLSVSCWYNDRNAVCEMHYDFLRVRPRCGDKAELKPACGSLCLGNLILIAVRLWLW